MALHSASGVKSIRKLILRTLTVTAVTILFLFLLLYSAMWIVIRGPSPAAKELLVRSLRETSAAGFLANWYLSEDEIQKILISSNAEAGKTIDSSLIRLPGKPKDTESFETGRPADTDHSGKTETSRPEPPETKDPSSGIELIDIVSGAYRGKLMIVTDPTRVSVGVIDEFSEENGGKQLPFFLKKYGAIAAVNAGGFNDFGGSGNGGTPVGLVINNGTITFGSEYDTYSICGFDRNGMLYVGTMTGKQALEAGVVSACSFGPALIINGQPVQFSSGGVNPRTAIGQRADGAILLLTLAGRQIDCIGATLADLTEIMYAYGAVNATNLDGGSSTMMYYKGERQIKSSSLVGERFLPTAIIVR